MPSAQMPGRLIFARQRADADRQRRCGKPDLPHGPVVSFRSRFESFQKSYWNALRGIVHTGLSNAKGGQSEAE